MKAPPLPVGVYSAKTSVHVGILLFVTAGYSTLYAAAWTLPGAKAIVMRVVGLLYIGFLSWLWLEFWNSEVIVTRDSITKIDWRRRRSVIPLERVKGARTERNEKGRRIIVVETEDGTITLTNRSPRFGAAWEFVSTRERALTATPSQGPST